MKNLIINADDYGISKSVNEAVIKMFKEGNLNSASIMVNAKYYKEALEFAIKNPDLKIGLHFNLTTGKSVLHPISIPLLVNNEGVFKNGFLKLLILSIFKRKEFLGQVEAELKAQIALLKFNKINISHIDGHRHIHYIFGIFEKVQKIAENENIPRIRIINENLFKTLTLSFPPISGLIKWFVLWFLGCFNGSKKYQKTQNYYYFFSIIHSCKITNQIVKKMDFSNFDTVEIMLHPGILELNTNENLEYEKSHLTSKFRTIEANFIKPKL